MKKIHVCILGISLLGACVSRAPTECELDKRSGLYSSSECGNGRIETSSNRLGARNTSEIPFLEGARAGVSNFKIPTRYAPKVIKVYLAEQILEGDAFLAGSWIALEIEGSKWGEPAEPLAAQTFIGPEKPATKTEKGRK